MVQYAEYFSPIGTLLLAAEEDALTGLRMDRPLPPECIPAGEHPVLKAAARWLDAYFMGQNPAIAISLRPYGTAFQRQVWQRLLEIPYGAVCTYGDIAREMEAKTGKRMSAQAVGGAVGSNPISLLIPCHRVVGSKGRLTGYAWGVDRKQWLLSHEGWKGMGYNDHQ